VRRAVLLAACAALLLPAPAAAQGLRFVDGGEGGIPLRSSGSLVVEWESDPATCEPVGRCGLRGLTTWRAPERGRLHLFPPGPGGARSASLSLGELFASAGTLAATRVRRGSHLCADASPGEGFAFVEGSAGRLSFRVADLVPGILTTSCAGPVFDDVESALPSIEVPYSRVRRGRMRVRLAGEGSFAAHGLRGSVRSTVTLRLGAPARDRGEEPGPRLPTERVRYLVNRFRVAEIRGEIGLDVAGAAAADECAPLDSCGLRGVVRVVPRVTAGSGSLIARVPVRHGRRAALASVGLRPGGVLPGTIAFGGAGWAGPGMIVASLSRADDPSPCRDSVLMRYGGVVLEPHGSRVTASLHVDIAGGAEFGASGRTRCPGPLLGGGGAPLAEAELPLVAFGARRVEVPLARTAPLADDGWTIAARPAVTVVLERRPLQEIVRREPRL
jgi:hypothetical protein